MKGTKTIHTERLILRKFKMEDAEAMFTNWASDDEVTKYLRWPSHDSVGLTKMLLDHWTQSYENDDFYNWAIVPKGSDEPIGNISVVSFDKSIGSAHMGYCIGKLYWNQGITSEALKAVIEYLFQIDGIWRIEAAHDTNNPHSGMVMKKCGMKYEGTMRRADKNNTGICNISRYAILKEDGMTD